MLEGRMGIQSRKDELKRLTEEIEGFSCQRCHECCRQPGFVYLSADEAEASASHLKMDVYHFVDQYCDIQDRRKLVLKKHSDESCVFLGDQGCMIHPKKPLQCREFPVRWRTDRSLEYCAGLRKLNISARSST